MRFNIRKIYLGTSVVSILLAASALSYAAPGGYGKAGTPPAEAIEACVSLAEGASCSFIGRGDRSVEGICKLKKGQDDAVLTCAPAHKKHMEKSE